MNAARASVPALVALVALATISPALPQAPAGAPTVDSIHRVFAGGKDERPTEASLRAELEHLGTPAVPALLAFLSGQQGAAGGSSPTAAERRLVEEVLRAWPADEVLDGIVGAARADVPLAVRIVAVRLAGRVRDARALAALDRLCGTFTRAEQQHPLVRDGLEAAIAEVLADRRAAAPAFALAADARTQPALLVPLARALGTSRANGASAALAKLLGKNPQLDVAVLDALGRRRGDSAEDESATRTLRSHLDSADAELRQQAVISLGRLRAGSVVAELIERLEDTDPRVRRCARWSLGEISGLQLGDGADDWAQWHERELAWHGETAPLLCGRLLQSEHSDADEWTSKAVAALNEIAFHPAFRYELALAAAQAVRDARPAVAVAACGALVKLGDPSTLGYLVDALEDSRDEVRTSALGGLRAWTSQELGPSATEWRAWLASPGAAALR